MAHGDLEKQTSVYRTMQKFPTKAMINRVKIDEIMKQSLDKPLHADLERKPRSASFDVVSEYLKQYRPEAITLS